MRTELLISIFTVMSCLFSNQAKADPSEIYGALTKQGMAILADKDDSTAFPKFINAFVIVRPHPDPATEKFIQWAERGDLQAFAAIGFYVYSGDPGFRQDTMSGKFAMMRVDARGNPAGAYFMGRSFFVRESQNKEDRLDDFVSGIQWLGKSTAMGEPRAYTLAMRLIDESKLTGEPRQQMIALFNQAMENGKKEQVVPSVKHDQSH